MIEIKNKKIYEKQLKLILQFLKINEEENINIYIDDFKENSLFIDKNCSKLYVKDDELVISNLVYIIAKYKFLKCLDFENKNKELYLLLGVYFANLKDAQFMILLNYIGNMKDLNSKIINIWGEEFKNSYDNSIKDIAKKIVCINILKKIDEDYFMKNNLDISKYLEFYYILKDLDIEDIEDNYNELEIYFNLMMGE